MLSGFLSAVLSVFLIAAVHAAAGPDDLFDARLPGALQPGQRETILSLESGRYTFSGGRLRDAFAPDPARPFLSNAQVAELLAGRGAPAGSGATGARVASAGAEEAHLRALSRLPPGPPGAVGYDGAAARAARTLAPAPSRAAAGAAGASVAPRAANPAVLHSRLLKSLTFKGTAPERAALAEAVEAILRSPTGRELAAQFVDERASAVLQLATFEGAQTGTNGMAQTSADPPIVTLNRNYLTPDPSSGRVAMAGTLAHELFGHAFEAQRARRAGISQLASYHYRGDEAGSRLIDWTIQLELAGRFVEDDPYSYLSDVEHYHRALMTASPYYAITLSLEEMKNPADTLKARRRLVAEAKAEVARGLEDLKAWGPIIAHFAEKHAVARARFAPAEATLVAYRDWAAKRSATLANIETAIESRLRYWSTPQGLAEKNGIVNAARSRYFAEREASLAAREAALRGMLASDGGALSSVIELPGIVVSVTPDGPGIDLAALREMYRDDRDANPEHWP